MLCKFQFEWGYKITRAQADELNTFIEPDIKLENEAPDGEGRIRVVSFETYIGDFERIAQVINPNAIKVNALLNKVVPSGLEILEMINGIQDKMKVIANADHLFNAKCEVHVPGLGLLAMTEVTWKEDCCTEELQEMIDAGWRIIAACPQPDQRRPDYVLGRSTNVKQGVLQLPETTSVSYCPFCGAEASGNIDENVNGYDRCLECSAEFIFIERKNTTKTIQ